MPETNFFWDPVSDNILQERDETGTVTAEHTTEPGLYGNLISQNRGGVESQYHFDALGSALALTDDSQQVTDTYAYTAFGEATERTGSTVNPFQHVGQSGYYQEDLAGGYCVRRRTFVPIAARWSSVDPLEFIIGTHQYQYAGNAPQALIDPSGFAGVQKKTTAELPCPDKCLTKKVVKCSFELSLSRHSITDDPSTSKPPKLGPPHTYTVVGLILKFSPPEPQGAKDWTCPAGACYGDLNRTRAKGDAITYTLKDGTVCVLDPSHFADPGPGEEGQSYYPWTGPGGVIPKCKAALNFVPPEIQMGWLTLEYRFRNDLVAKVEAKFTIEAACRCGYGHSPPKGIPKHHRSDEPNEGNIEFSDTITLA